MANSINTTTRRAVLGAMTLGGVASLAPVAIGAMPETLSARHEWDNLVAEYRRLAAAAEDDAQHGALARASNAFDRERLAIVGNAADVGRPSGLNPEQSDRYSACYNRLAAAEARHSRDFCEPRWAAERRIYDTPAPTLQALAEKIDIAENEGMMSEDDVSDIIVADARRLLQRGRA